MSFWSKPEPKSNGAVLFLFIGIVLTLGLVGVVVTESMVGTAEGGDRAEKAAQAALDVLPVGASDVVGPLEIPAFADQTFVFSYTRGGAVILGMVQWDRGRRGFGLRSELVLSGAPYGFKDVGTVAAGPSWGISPIIEVRGPSRSESGGETVAFVAVHGEDLAQVPFADGDGTMPAEFLIGEAGAASWNMDTGDVTGDGVPEVFQRERYRLGEVETEEVRAYVWDSGRLAFDEQLSWALTVRSDLFPEPGE